MSVASVDQGPTAGEYIGHHLTHFQNKHMSGVIDFSVYNLDSIFWSVFLGVLACFFLWRAAKGATAHAPGRFQAAVEILVEMVDNQAKGIVHNANSRKLVSPLALTVFVWIFLLNAMDLFPVDLFPLIWESIFGAMGGDAHHAYMRVVPTADLSTTLGMSCSVLLICLFYNIKIKGLGGWIHELFCSPFGTNILLWPLTFLFNLVEYVSKPLSHSLRLYGNIYAGEIIFMLLWMWAATGLVGQLAGGVLALGWAIFHILIVALQAYIFMMLTVVYMAMAHESH